VSRACCAIHDQPTKDYAGHRYCPYGPTEEKVTPCGEDPPYPYTGKTVKTKSMMPAHKSDLYEANVGCPSATSALQLGATRRQHSAAAHRYVEALAAVDDLMQEAAICPLKTDAVWAAMDSYAEIAYPAMSAMDPAFFSYGQKIKAAMWKLAASWLAINKTTPVELAGNLNTYGMMNDTDYTGLWVKDGSCIWAFRGSDSQIDVGMGFLDAMLPASYHQYNNGTPGAPNGVQYSDVEFHGLQVHLGVKVELEALLTKMQANDGLATIKDTCTSGLTLTGHSLGGQ